jgi:protein-tyrosine-phosphatase
MPVPLFVCYANCCRSVLAHYLYENLHDGFTSLSAGVVMGDAINQNAHAMLRHWGIDAGRHQPRQLTRALCDQADGLFIMGPEYLDAILEQHGEDLAGKAYLFADPFSLPRSFRRGEYLVRDPSFDLRHARDLTREFFWLRERVQQIHGALHGRGQALVPATRYLEILRPGARPAVDTGPDQG